MNFEIKTAIIPIIGLNFDFLPIIKVLNKEILPLADKPMIDYILQEAKNSEIEKIVFVFNSNENKKNIADYYKKNKELQSILQKNNNKKRYLKILEQQEDELKDISLSFIFQPASKSIGNILFKTKNYIKKQGFAVLYPNDVFESKIPVIDQLKRIFYTAQKPIIALTKINTNSNIEASKNLFLASVEKIANKLYKIKEIKFSSANSITNSSDLIIVGRFIFTLEIFNYLEKTPTDDLFQALNSMILDGKMVYGYEFDGTWFNCETKMNWLKANLHFCLNHSEYGTKLKKYVKELI